MGDLADLDALRNAVLLQVYEQTAGETIAMIEEGEIASALGADAVAVTKAAKWLVDRDLLSFPVAGAVVSITPEGVDAAETLLRDEGAELAVTVTIAELRLVEGFVTQVEAAVEARKITLTGDDLADLQAQLDTLRAQSKSPKPRRKIISAALKVIKYTGDASVQQIIGGLAFEGLKQLLT